MGQFAGDGHRSSADGYHTPVFGQAAFMIFDAGSINVAAVIRRDVFALPPFILPKAMRPARQRRAFDNVFSISSNFKDGAGDLVSLTVRSVHVAADDFDVIWPARLTARPSAMADGREIFDDPASSMAAFIEANSPARRR